MQLAASIDAPPGASAAELAAVDETRRTLARWTLLGLELSVARARGVADHPRLKPHLEALELLRPGEWEAMVAVERHNTVWFWIVAALNRLRPSGTLTGTRAIDCY